MEKVKEEEFRSVCKLAQLVERNAKLPTYVTKDLLEGIELSAGKIISFQINRDQEKVYNMPIADKQIVSVIGAFAEPQRPSQVLQKPPSLQLSAYLPENNTVQKDGPGASSVAYIPDIITGLLFEKWAGFSVPQRLIMLQNTDSRQIEERKGRAGQKYKYVPISYMIKAANMAFEFAWSVRVISWIETSTEIICNVELSAEVGGKIITKAATGQKDIAFKKDTKEYLCKGDDYKSAQADAIKKALSLFGIAQDVYSGEV